MIISRTPLRVSFVGGGTDLKEFYSRENGKVLSTAINKYLYVTIKRQVDIVEHKYRIGYSKTELTNHLEDIEHPIVREALKLMEIDFPIEINTFSDIPAGTGLGSSSSFTVGLLHALFALKGTMASKSKLAYMGADIEINKLGRTMGAQDHFAAAYGNLNMFTFQRDGLVLVEPVFYRNEVKKQLNENLLLFYTGIKRNASDVLKKQAENTADKFDVLRKMKNLVDPLNQILSTGNNLDDFGRLLHENWMLKKSLSSEISADKIDLCYETARKAGALGGKVLGAGGGGFMLFYATPEKQKAVLSALSDLYRLNFKFDSAGTRITYYDQNP